MYYQVQKNMYVHNFFYHSEVYQLIRDGVSDMHCMSDEYLAEELEQEYSQKI